MTVGIVGLGLIGGSMAKAYKAAGHRVLAAETDRAVFAYAMLSGCLDGELTAENMGEAELLLLAVYPKTAIEFLGSSGAYISKDALVIDCCGTKSGVCAAGFAAAERYGFTFVGGHPMAGTERSGFKYSGADMFFGAAMVIVPPVFDDVQLLSRVKTALMPCGFGSFTVTNAKKHDEEIAFTSQLAHLVSGAYIRSPRAQGHKGFSAGSYKDMTRVAWLDENLWTELFLDNAGPLLEELGGLIDTLNLFKSAIERGDADKLRALLYEGKWRKEAIDRA